MMEKIATKTFWKIQSMSLLFSFVGPNLVLSGWVGSYAQDRRSSGERLLARLGTRLHAFFRAEPMETHSPTGRGAHST